MTTNTSTTSSKKSSSQKAPVQAGTTQGTFVWFELRTANAEKSVGFFSKVLGWKTERSSMGGQESIMFSNGEKNVAHVAVTPGPSTFISYVAVDDVDAAAKRVTAAGGKVHGQPMDLPNIGRMVEVEDGDGAAFFLYRASMADTGQPTSPGGFLWNEMWAKDTRKSLAFLTSVLGYSVRNEAMPGGPYHVLSHGELMQAGVMESEDPKGPACFVPYIHVADVAATRLLAIKLGGQALGEPMDIPGIGRVALLVDPDGARFAIRTPAHH